MQDKRKFVVRLTTTVILEARSSDDAVAIGAAAVEVKCGVPGSHTSAIAYDGGYPSSDATARFITSH